MAQGFFLCTCVCMFTFHFTVNKLLIFINFLHSFVCMQGEMEVTPACYSHLLSPLMSLANGRIAVVLEGGYCLESLAEGAALTLKTLLGDPCPKMEPLDAPCERFLFCFIIFTIFYANFTLLFQHTTYNTQLHIRSSTILEEFVPTRHLQH